MVKNILNKIHRERTENIEKDSKIEDINNKIENISFYQKEVYFIFFSLKNYFSSVSR